MFDKIVESCQFLLHNFHGAQEIKSYLDNRINIDSQNKFQFGYFPDIFNLKVLTSLIGDNSLEDFKLFYSKKVEDSMYPRIINFSYFDNHPLIMPYKDPYGNIVGLIGRSILSDVKMKNNKISKYKNTAESNYFKKGHLLFGLYENKQAIIDNDMVYVVEGQFDVVKAVENGFTNIIALGNANMTSYQFSVINRYTNNIILLLDNDDAGDKGRKSIIDKFGKFANIQNFYLPDGYKDIDEFLSKNNYEDLSFVIKN
jgi:DNA primase catalytic core